MTSATATLYKDLINAGIAPGDAQAIELAFAAEPEFLDGLEQIAQIIALKQAPGLIPPVGEPWRTIHITMASCIQAGDDVDTAWRTAIQPLDMQLQFALTNAVNARQKAILDFEAQKSHKKIKTKHYVHELKQLGYSFRLNQCDDTIEVNGQRISDALAAQIRCQMRDRGFSNTTEVEDSYLMDAFNHPFHPVRDYLTSLVYDGGHYIEELAQYFQDDYQAFPTWLRRWLIGAVAKAFTGAQNPMLVLDGDQNLGKSTFARWLGSPLPQMFVESPINPENKDDLIRLANKWIWEVMELGGTIRKADQEALKGFLTLEEVTVRLPYGRHALHKPALASFIGTVNNAGGILNDPTGSRRFLISKLTKIDWGYMSLDIHKIWAEAMAAYLAGESWQLTPDERKLRDAVNEEYQVEDPIEGLLKKFFKLDPNNTHWWMPTTDIQKILEDPYQGNFHGNGSMGTTMKLAETMKRLGHKKERRNNPQGQRVNGYVGISIYP